MRTLRLSALALLAATATCLTACSSPSDGPATGGSGSGTQPGTAVPTADVLATVRPVATLHDRLPADVRAAGVLQIGTTEQPGTAGLPYIGTDGGTTVGLHVDLADAVAAVLGVKAQRVIGTFPTIVPGTQNGKFDVGLANLGVTKAREQVVDFATYLDDGQSFLAGTGSAAAKLTTVHSLVDLCGLTIATSPGSTFQKLLENGKDDCAKAGKPGYTVQYFSTSAPVLLGLSNGKVDVEFGPTLSLKYDAAHISGTRYLGQISSTPVGFVTAKGSPLAPLLRDAVNELIRTGVYQRILTKWGIASSAITTSELNPTPTF